MYDVASSSAGCRVLSATSRDENHPASNIIDGSSSTFWCTTGLFPHEFILTLESATTIRSIAMQSCDVKDIMIEISGENDINDFQPIAEKTFPLDSSSLQHHEFELQETKARHVRFIIKSGHSSITSVHKVIVDGDKVKRIDRF